MENHISRTAFITVICLLLPALSCFMVEAREGRARLSFQKTALRKTNVYVVKKGDFLAGIFRKQRGDERIPYALIRRLNPGIRDLNRIYPGQKIVLPVRESLEPPKVSSEVHDKSDSPLPGYGIKERDRTPAAESSPPIIGPGESAPVETAMKTPPTVERILGVIRPVVNRMNGTLVAKGNYFIPLKEGTQITIDCSLIPVVELDDGTTVLLDFGNRLSDDIKGMIGQSWTNYAFLPNEELGDGPAGIKGIIRRSRNYEMSEAGSHLPLILNPEIRVHPDWTITAKKTAVGAVYRQGLFLLGSNEKPFPGEVRSFLEKNGLAVTEISGDRAVSGPATPKAAPTPTDLRGLKGIALAEQLLKALGETPVAGVEVILFDQAKSGFNLSIIADLLLRRGGKRFVIHTKRLPEQFVRILNEGGAEVVPIGEGASGRSLIEGLLRDIQIPVSFGHFAFRIPEDGNLPRLTSTFPALRVTSDGEPLYLFDFDISPDVQAFLGGLTGGRIAKY